MIVRASGVAVVIGAVGLVGSLISPWPGALIVRAAFNFGGTRTSRALEPHVPSGVSAQLDEHYDETDPDAYLDVFHPTTLENADRSPTIVWVHGGGWVAGSKNQIANYARILAARGYSIVGVDYSLAPAHVYPSPLRQVNAALSYLEANAKRLQVNPSRLVLAGDSAGAHIAAQMANIITVPSYAAAVGIVPAVERSQLVGMVLYCGAYDFIDADLAAPFRPFATTMIWAYSGTRNFMNDQQFATASVTGYVTPDFPPTFISAGNADPLLPQSVAFARVVADHGVHVETLFFPNDYGPRLPHEYQFNLDADAGRLALERSVKFLLER